MGRVGVLFTQITLYLGSKHKEKFIDFSIGD